MEEFQSANERKIAALEAQLAELKNVLVKPNSDEKPSSGQLPSLDVNSRPYIPPHLRHKNEGDNKLRTTRFRKCALCYKNNVYRCTHCFQCGSGQHRRNECPVQKN